MEDVLAGGHFPDLDPVHEGLHADDAFRSAKLIDIFVVFLVLDQRDELLVAVDEGLMGHPSHHFPFLLPLLPTRTVVAVLAVSY